MKTKTIGLIIVLFCMQGFTSIRSQGLYSFSSLIERLHEKQKKERAKDKVNPWLTLSGFLEEGGQLESVEWADNTIGGSAGFVWSDDDGNSETSFCLGAEYLHRIVGERQNPDGAGYLGAFANYLNSSSDNFDQSIFRVGPKFSYFDRITPFNEVQLVYGAKAFYEFGSRDFSGSSDDLTGFGGAIYTGANFRICSRASVGVEVPVMSYVSRTFESGGNEFKADNFWLGINKDNLITATLRWVLDDIDEDLYTDR